VELLDGDGRRLDADYLAEPDGSYIALMMESRSGMSGSRPPRNPDYNQALTVPLMRLGQLKALLVDAVVDSRHVHDRGLRFWAWPKRPWACASGAAWPVQTC
jgi:hypothetical protein